MVAQVVELLSGVERTWV